MNRPIRRTVSAATAALIVLTIGVPPSSGASTTTCKISGAKAQTLGPTYVTYATGKPGYRVRGTSCAAGLKVVKAFHNCRLKKGKTGRCTSKVLGYSCRETRPGDLRSPLSFDGDVACKRGSAVVSHHYTQDT